MPRTALTTDLRQRNGFTAIIMTYLKPQPQPDKDTAPFWDGARERRLVVQQCTKCGTHRFPPSAYCAKCQSTEHKWIDTKGRGKVYSWIVVEHPIPGDVYRGDVPYVVALIELDEGVRLVSNIVGCDPYKIVADMLVQVKFDDVTETLTLPRFTPV